MQYNEKIAKFNSKTKDMKIILSIILILTSFNLVAQLPSLSWAKQTTGKLTRYDSDIIKLPNGDILLSGTTWGDVDFNPPANTATLNCNGSWYAVLMKYDNNGNYQWGFGFGNYTFGCSARAIAVDSQNNIYMAGEYYDVADFDPSSATYSLGTPTYSIPNIYIAKYSSTGTFLWVKGIEGSENKECRDIAVDNNGNVFITGSFFGTVDFDPSNNSNLITAQGLSDGFFAKYDSNGALLFAKSFGGSEYDGGAGISVKNSGNISVSGSFGGTSDFDPSTNNFTLSANSNTLNEGFVADYNSTGQFNWVCKFGTKVGGEALKIQNDGLGNIYATGYDSTAFICVSKINSSGNIQWSHTLETFPFPPSWPEDNQGRSISYDPNGNIYIGGSYRKKVDFDPSAAVYTLQANSSKPFIAKYDVNGNFKWAYDMGDNIYFGQAIGFDNQSIYLSGVFGNIADFDPSPSSSYTLAPYSGTITSGCGNLFVSKYGQPPVSVLENKLEDEIVSAFPNPTSTFLKIRSMENTKIVIRDVMGRSIIQEFIMEGENLINFEGLATGVYILEVQGKNRSYKIIKN